MADGQLLDPGTATATTALAADPGKKAAMTDPGGVDPGTASSVTGPDKPLSADTATSLFGHMTDPSLGLQPRKVKTESIQHSTKGLLDAISTGTEINPQRSAKRQSTIRSSAENMLTAAADAGLHGANQYAYMLATAERESHLGNMMDEDRSDAWFNREYGPQTSKGKKQLGNINEGDGALFHGRGLVQITGRRNYTDWTQRLNDQGVKVDGEDADLVNHPEQAKDPKIAAKIAAEGMRDGSFTTKKLGDYVNDDKTDYVGARRVINGKDHASEIATRARAFEGLINQHKGDFYGTMMASEMKNLPTAQEGQLSGDPSNPGVSMLSPTPIGGDPGQFESIDQYAKKHHAGRFIKDKDKEKPKDPTLPANVPIPLPRPKDL